MEEIHITLAQTRIMDTPINACIGYFDGLHKGHQKLIEKVVQISKQNGGKPALITFDPDPWTVLKGIERLTHITTMKERKEIASSLGIELWIVLSFTKEMANLSISSFHEQILNPLHLHTLVCGYDFHYGAKGKGDVTSLKAQTQFAVEVIDEVSSNCQKISSSRIEALILQGDMQAVETLLTRPYKISGIIVHGRQNGRKMGYPTANLEMDEAYICPKKGVYAGLVEIDKQSYEAIINIGNNPTFGDFQEASIEAHLFDFDQDVYGKEVSFIFLRYMREDVRFESIAKLVEQLHRDSEDAKMYFKKRKEGISCV